jgi:hypothetical protein
LARFPSKPSEAIAAMDLFTVVPRQNVVHLQNERLGEKLDSNFSDKTSWAFGAPPSMKMGFSGLVREDGSVCGTSMVDGGCLEVGKICVDIDPVDKTDPRR